VLADQHVDALARQPEMLCRLTDRVGLHGIIFARNCAKRSSTRALITAA
jgi:hypothetical protein